MKKTLLLVMSVLAMTLFITAGAKADMLTIDFSSAPANGLISFAGGDFTFVNAFSVDNSVPYNTINGNTGTIGGTYQIGTIGPGGLGEIATVSTVDPQLNNNIFTINDGATPFTATVNWFTISTATNGAIGGLNSNLVMNLTDFNYAGSNPELFTLLSYLQGTGTISWQFASTGFDLNALAAASNTSPITTSYSGSISAVPLPPSALLLGSGLLGMIFLGRRQKKRS